MAGLFATLHVARSGVLAQQTAVRVASQNITNAEVEGYTRQRASLATAYTVTLPLGVLGSGVRVDHIARLREPLLDASYRQDAGRAAAFDMRHQLLGRVEQVFGEPSDAGLAHALDAFHNAWADLANQPNSTTTRGVIVQRGQQLASTLHGFTARLEDTATYARTKLEDAVTSVNRLATQIAAVNVEIVRAEADGTIAPDLRDKRDLLIDSLATFGSVRVIERGRGDTAVLVDGAMVVDGADSTPLDLAGSPPEVRIGSRALRFENPGSTMGELIGLLTTHLPAVQQRLDRLAGALVAQVNALHTSGYTLSGEPGGFFFDPAGTTARSIAVVATPAQVVSSDAAGETGNNRIALALAALRGPPLLNEVAGEYAAWRAVQDNLGGLSFADHFRGTVTEVGTMVSDADSHRTVAATLASQAELRRASVSGVSTDEELILLMQHQQAYTAAARLIGVVDEMMRTILDLR